MARTYVIRRLRILGGAGCPEHPQADISDQPSEGQAWLSKEALRERWGGMIAFYRYWGKISEAVEKTAGLYCTYDGLPVDPVYHSTSGGYTESAAAVWGRDVPYLQAVASPHEQDSPRLFESVEFARKNCGGAWGPADDGDPTHRWSCKCFPAVDRTCWAAGGRSGVHRHRVSLLAGPEPTPFPGRQSPAAHLHHHRPGGGHVPIWGAWHGIAGYDFRAIIAHYYRAWP